MGFSPISSQYQVTLTLASKYYRSLAGSDIILSCRICVFDNGYLIDKEFILALDYLFISSIHVNIQFCITSFTYPSELEQYSFRLNYSISGIVCNILSVYIYSDFA